MARGAVLLSDLVVARYPYRAALKSPIESECSGSIMGLEPIELAKLIRRSWPALREAIRHGETITYSELATRAGPPLHRRHLHRQLLVPLSARCRRAGLPDLSALVVRKDTGMPGAGWHGPVPAADASRAWAEALAECFAHPWPSQPDPNLLQM